MTDHDERKNAFHIPKGKGWLPWLAGIATGAVAWVAMLFLVDASGVLSLYVGVIVGLNAGAFVAAGIARPAEDEDEGFFLSPHRP